MIINKVKISNSDELYSRLNKNKGRIRFIDGQKENKENQDFTNIKCKMCKNGGLESINKWRRYKKIEEGINILL